MKSFKVESTSNTYEILWSASLKNLEYAQELEKGPVYFYFTSMIMAYFAYEAFLNHVLVHIAPEVMEDERKYFSVAPYRGTEGKLKKVCEIARIEFPNKGEEPYQTIKQLQILRDYSVHGKTEFHEKIVSAESGEELPQVQSKLNELVTAEKAEAALSKLKEFIIGLNGQIRANLYCDRLTEYPLEGFIGHASASEIAS